MCFNYHHDHPIPWPLACESWGLISFSPFALPFFVLSARCGLFGAFWCSCWSTGYFPGLAPDFWHSAVICRLASCWTLCIYTLLFCFLWHIAPFLSSPKGSGNWATCAPHFLFSCRARFIVFWLVRIDSHDSFSLPGELPSWSSLSWALSVSFRIWREYEVKRVGRKESGEREKSREVKGVGKWRE